MKSCDASSIDINSIVFGYHQCRDGEGGESLLDQHRIIFGYHQCRDGEGGESLLDQHRISDVLPTEFHHRLDTKCF
ncbi:hypothetical protein RchiOBHm_Chr6g0263491 [Rosa chinensis]|uniref:Uncharacterized protein n=1 Tax=Rosa chinensis TaxID=74649 RepID=A0A2P6PNW9_ROSCH|nr:hypothetical protein RchiOBHm_Chr6g0263491 [Rosa chinensis]